MQQTKIISDRQRWYRLQPNFYENSDIRKFLDIALEWVPDRIGGMEDIFIYRNPKSENINLHHFGRNNVVFGKLNGLYEYISDNDLDFIFKVPCEKTPRTPWDYVIVKPMQSTEEFDISKGASDLNIGPQLITPIPLRNPMDRERGIIVEEYLSPSDGWHHLYYQKDNLDRKKAIESLRHQIEKVHNDLNCVYYVEGVIRHDNYSNLWASEVCKHFYFNSMSGESKFIDFGASSLQRPDLIEKESEILDRFIDNIDNYNFHVR